MKKKIMIVICLLCLLSTTFASTITREDYTNHMVLQSILPKDAKIEELRNDKNIASIHFKYKKYPFCVEINPSNSCLSVYVYYQANTKKSTTSYYELCNTLNDYDDTFMKYTFEKNSYVLRITLEIGIPESGLDSYYIKEYITKALQQTSSIIKYLIKHKYII